MLDWLNLNYKLSPDQQNFFTETLTELFLSYFIQPGEVSADIGANHGFHSRTMIHSTGDKGHVHLFEPNPSLIPELKSIARAGKDFVHEIAAIENEEKLDFFVPEDDGWGTLDASLLQDRKIISHYQVSGASASNYFCVDDDVRLIKIDVEGSELRTLLGLIPIIVKSKPIFIIEEYYSTNAIDFLKVYGYSFLNMKGELLNESNQIFVNFIAVHGSFRKYRNWIEKIDRNFLFNRYATTFTKF